MSAKFYQAALAAVRRAWKMRDEMPEDSTPEELEATVNRHLKFFLHQHKQALDLCEQMMDMVKTKKENKVNTFFVTIRPSPDADWPAFRDKVHKWCGTSMAWSWNAYVFEQKGMSDDTLGAGFHVHIVGSSTLHKANLLNRCADAFKKFAAKAAIQVSYANTPWKVWNRYLLNHDSTDGHKELTKKWDAKWREREGLKHAYGAVDHAELQEEPDTDDDASIAASDDTEADDASTAADDARTQADDAGKEADDAGTEADAASTAADDASTEADDTGSPDGGGVPPPPHPPLKKRKGSRSGDRAHQRCALGAPAPPPRRAANRRPRHDGTCGRSSQSLS